MLSLLNVTYSSNLLIDFTPSTDLGLYMISDINDLTLHFIKLEALLTVFIGTLQLVTLYIFSCLDNCSILYYGLSSKLLSKLQIVLNDCVCFVYKIHRSFWENGISVTALPKDRHILPRPYLFSYFV